MDVEIGKRQSEGVKREEDTSGEEKMASPQPVIVKFEPGDKDNPHNWSMV